MTARALTTTNAAPPAAAPAITQTTTSVLRRQCACGQHTAGGITCDACARRKSPLRRMAAGTTTPDAIPGIVDDVLRGAGQGFDGAPRTFMEARFARDFSGVRLHTDGRAAESANAVDAMAYTVGNHIVFGAGRYAPGTPAGASLLAHELTHVAQNAGGFAAAATAIGRPGDAAEVEADRVAGNVMRGNGHVAVQQAPNATLHPLGLGEAIGLGVGVGVAGTALGLAIAGVAGAFDKDNFTDDELRAYIQVLAGGKIEGKTDSDNKARALVRRWATASSAFALTPPQLALLIREMQDGRVSDDDRNGIVTLMEKATAAELADVLAPASLDFPKVLADIGTGSHGDRVVMLYVRRPDLHGDTHFTQFVEWYAATHLDGAQQTVAHKVLFDVLAIPGLDFADATEFRNDIFKRVRTSDMMKESQATSNGFDYPENVTPDKGCADYQPPTGMNKINLGNARVNKAARQYWTDVQQDPTMIYYFNLTEEGRRNGYRALVALFEPQQSICDKTLIHCDFLVNVIQFRAFAETIGVKKFDALIRNGTLLMQLNYTGFAPPPWDQVQPTPKTAGFRTDVRPRAREDFAIGDHVVFWNHLAFDGLNVAQQSPWRLENAVLIDKNEAGDDLFQGHGSGDPESERQLLVTLLNEYNGLARSALAYARAVDSGQPVEARMRQEYPMVSKTGGKWIVTDPGRQEPRRGRQYDLAEADMGSPESDPLLPGLRDPLDFSQLNTVSRPAESAPGKLYRPD